MEQTRGQKTRDVAAASALVLVRVRRVALSLRVVAERRAVRVDGVPVLGRATSCGVLARQNVAPSCAAPPVDATVFVDASRSLRRVSSVTVVINARQRRLTRGSAKLAHLFLTHTLTFGRRVSFVAVPPVYTPKLAQDV